MKKLFVILLTVVLVFSVAGCNSDSGSEKKGSYLNKATYNPTADYTEEPDSEFSEEPEIDNESDNPDESGEHIFDDSENELSSSAPDKTDSFVNSTDDATSTTDIPVETTAPTSSSVVVTFKPISTHSSAATTSTVAAKSTATAKPTATVSEPTKSLGPVPTVTEAPVITEGPEEYYELTLYVEMGGGYVYINEGVDSETNINKGWYKDGDYISITAVPYRDCTFDGWYIGEDEISLDENYNFFMPACDYSLTARFSF